MCAVEWCREKVKGSYGRQVPFCGYHWRMSPAQLQGKILQARIRANDTSLPEEARSTAAGKLAELVKEAKGIVDAALVEMKAEKQAKKDEIKRRLSETDGGSHDQRDHT